MFLLTFLCFLFNLTATTEIYTLSLHDALPISRRTASARPAEGFPYSVKDQWPDPQPDRVRARQFDWRRQSGSSPVDRKSTRLNSSHLGISYAVFCLKKKKII